MRSRIKQVLQMYCFFITNYEKISHVFFQAIFIHSAEKLKAKPEVFYYYDPKEFVLFRAK